MTNLVDLTKSAFAPEGAVAAAMRAAGRSHTYNPKQDEYATLMAQAILGRGDLRGLITLLEGETGVGKTVGYLVPMCLHLGLTGSQKTGRKGLVSTYRLELQRQIVDREFAIAAAVAKALTGADLTAAPRKGRRNFISVSRVRGLMASLKEAGQLTDETRAALESLIEFPGGDLMLWREVNDMPARVRAEDICLLPGASLSEAAPYYDHIEASKDADVLVVTHALLMRSCLRWNRLLDGDDEDERRFDVGVIDEADRLPSAADSVFSARISVPMVERIVESLEPYDVPDTVKAVSDWRKWMDSQFTSLSENAPSVFRREGAGGFAVLADPRIAKSRVQARDLAANMALELRKGAGVALRQKLPSSDYHEIVGISDQLMEFVKACDNLGDKLKSPVMQWSPVRTYGAFSVVPLWPGRLIANVWRAKEPYQPWLRSVIMTSATLDAPGERPQSQFYGFRDQIGIVPEWHHYNDTGSTSLSPDKFGKMRFMLADRNVPKPGGGEDEEEESNPEWIAYSAQGIVAAKERGGRSLVLLPSYRDTASIATKARELGVDLLEHKPGTRLADYLKAFRADPNAVLITPGGWEGLDLPGLLKHVIIPRVPFPMLDSARNRALLDAFALRGIDENKAMRILFTYYSADTRRRLRQGIGRGIRSFQDDVTLWVLDPRFPLPRTITSNRRLRQTNLPSLMYVALVNCIPNRFRSGVASTYDDAEIFPFQGQAKDLTATG